MFLPPQDMQMTTNIAWNKNGNLNKKSVVKENCQENPICMALARRLDPVVTHLYSTGYLWAIRARNLAV